MRIYSHRLLNAMGFLAICVLLLTGFYLEYVVGIHPCPLCMLQRMLFSLIGLIFVVAFFHPPRKRGAGIYDGIILVFAILGMLTAGRQLWIQAHPKESPAVCVPGLDYMMTHFPFTEALKFLFEGAGNCAEVSWRLFGLSIAAWSFIAFMGLGVFVIFRLVCRTRL